MNQHMKPIVVLTFLSGALMAAAPAPTGHKAQASPAYKVTLLAYASDADRQAYQAQLKALEAKQHARWAELQREHKLALSNPMLSKDDRQILEQQQKEENAAAQKTYAGEIDVLKLKYKDGDIAPA